MKREVIDNLNNLSNLVSLLSDFSNVDNGEDVVSISKRGNTFSVSVLCKQYGEERTLNYCPSTNVLIYFKKNSKTNVRLAKTLPLTEDLNSDENLISLFNYLIGYFISAIEKTQLEQKMR